MRRIQISTTVLLALAINGFIPWRVSAQVEPVVGLCRCELPISRDCFPFARKAPYDLRDLDSAVRNLPGIKSDGDMDGTYTFVDWASCMEQMGSLCKIQCTTGLLRELAEIFDVTKPGLLNALGTKRQWICSQGDTRLSPFPNKAPLPVTDDDLEAVKKMQRTLDPGPLPIGALPFPVVALPDALAPYGKIMLNPNRPDELERFVRTVERILNDPRASKIATTSMIAVLVAYGAFKAGEAYFSGGALSAEPISASLAMSLVLLIAQKSGIQVPDSEEASDNVVLESVSSDSHVLTGVAMIDGVKVKFSSDEKGAKARADNLSCQLNTIQKKSTPTCRVEKR